MTVCIDDLRSSLRLEISSNRGDLFSADPNILNCGAERGYDISTFNYRVESQIDLPSVVGITNSESLVAGRQSLVTA
jgi:hypothetical protein